MAIYRVNKTDDYTVIANYHLKEKEMSLKAKGLLTLFLSLPSDWDFSSNGITAIVRESRNTVNEIMRELEAFKYLKRTAIRNNKGIIKDWQYDIYEKPYTNYQDMDNQDIDNQDIDNCIQVNTKELNTKEVNTKLIKEKIYKKENFKKPTLEEIKEYCEDRNNNVDYEKLFNHYEANGWYRGKTKIKDWKACVRTWEVKKGDEVCGLKPL